MRFIIPMIFVFVVIVSKTSDYAGVQTYTVAEGNKSEVVVVTK